MITRLPATSCPVCQATLDAHGDELDDRSAARAPQAGDYSVCLYCLAILVFTDARTLRALTAAERAALPADDPVFQVLATIVRFQAAQH